MSRSLTATRLHHVATLEKRAAFLERRIAKASVDLSYDKAEAAALRWAASWLRAALDVAPRHFHSTQYATEEGYIAVGLAAVDAAIAAGRAIEVCSCERGSGCDVMRILSARPEAPLERLVAS